MKLVILTLELAEAKALQLLLKPVTTEVEKEAVRKLEKQIQRTINGKQKQ